MKIFITSVILLVFSGLYLLFFWIQESHSNHLKEMNNLCETSFSSLWAGGRDKVSVGKVTCTITANDEFLIFVSEQMPGLEMVCYDFESDPYTVESQRCSVHSRED